MPVLTPRALAARSTGNGHGHTHEHMDNPGEFDKRDPPLDEAKRNWDERAFTVGIGGPVGR
jgi:urease accessory protein